MNDFIAKPVEPDELLAALQKWGSQSPAPASAVAPPASQSDLPLWDLPSALRRLGGNQDLLDRLVAAFCRDEAGGAERIAEAFAADDLPAAERHAHTLKGVAGNLGAKRLQEVSGRVEKALRQGQATDLAELRAVLVATLGDLPASGRGN